MECKPKVYLESSTISYLTARPTRDIIINAKQELTRRWWKCLEQFEPYVSDTVENEIKQGDPFAAKLRIDAIFGIPRLHFNETVERLMFALLEAGIVPKNVEADATHIAYATVYRMDFLITWNQKHIATHAKRTQIEALIVGYGFRPPRLMTPEQLLIEME